MAVKAWDNKPVFNDYEAWLKLKLEREQIVAHFPEDTIRIILNITADVTGEVHAFPIFKSDTRKDLVNRYCDNFPAELQLTMKEVHEMNRNLFNPNAMSKEGLNMAKLRIPLTLYTILSTHNPEYWSHLDAKKIKELASDFSRLKVGDK